MRMRISNPISAELSLFVAYAGLRLGLECPEHAILSYKAKAMLIPASRRLLTAIASMVHGTIIVELCSQAFQRHRSGFCNTSRPILKLTTRESVYRTP